MLSLRRTKQLLLLLLVSGTFALLYYNIVVFHLSPGVSTRLSPHRDLNSFSYQQTSARNSPRTAILIFTQMRSGSSFLGELFNQHPDVFYVYEPLWALKNYPNKTHNVSDAEQIRLLQGVLTCDFKNLVDVMPFYLNNKTFGAPTKSRVILKLCRSFKKLTRNDLIPGLMRCPIPKELVAEVLGRACSARRFTVVKTIRLANISVLQAIARETGLDLRILHLVRDPRATIASRLALRHHRKDNVTTFFDDGIDDSEVGGLCESIMWNLKNVTTSSCLRERYTLLRFEDLAAAPVEQMRRLYKSVDVPLHKAVYRWVRVNTNTSDSNRAPFSTRRRSKERTGGWRSALSFAQVEMIQKKCRQTMALLGYRLLRSSKELVDTSVDLYSSSVMMQI
ncbi:carbohydrate sulfotransferase 3-like [Branchiostoma lanceolatum]|uniref:carbohydrate sulfotransferase 3-like n=1 Tax=Branchiostoma lanceolatum TaxID=7740 RepID=UPI0034549F90